MADVRLSLCVKTQSHGTYPLPHAFQQQANCPYEGVLNAFRMVLPTAVIRKLPDSERQGWDRYESENISGFHGDRGEYRHVDEAGHRRCSVQLSRADLLSRARAVRKRSLGAGCSDRTPEGGAVLRPAVPFLCDELRWASSQKRRHQKG